MRIVEVHLQVLTPAERRDLANALLRAAWSATLDQTRVLLLDLLIEVDDGRDRRHRLTCRNRPDSVDDRLTFPAEALSLLAVASQPISAEGGVARWSFGATARKRRAGRTPSCLDGAKRRAWADDGSEWLSMQETLL